MEEISLRELIQTMLKGKWMIALLTAVCVLVTGAYSFYIADPVYEVKTRFVVAPVRLSGSSSISTQITVPQDSDQNNTSIIKGIASDLMVINNIDAAVSVLLKDYEFNMSSYVRLLKSSSMLETVIKELNLPLQRKQLDKKIEVQPMKNENNKETDVIEVTVKYNNPQTAVNIADILYREFDKIINQRISYKNKTAMDFIVVEKEKEKQKYLDAFDKIAKIDPMSIDTEKGQKEYNDLKYEADLARKTYVAYQNKIDEFNMQIAVSKNIPVVKIVFSPSASGEPIAPKKVPNVAMAALLGIMAGVFIVLFKDYWKKTAAEAEDKNLIA